MLEPFWLTRATAAGAGVALLWLAARTYTRREGPAAGSFAGLLGTLGVTALCTGATAHAGTAYKLVWLYTGLAIPLALARFAFDYYGITLVDSRGRLWTALAPAVVGAAGGTLVVLETMTGPTVPVLTALPAVALDAATALDRVGRYYTTAVMLLAVGLVVRTVYRYDHVETRLGPVIAFVGVWPWLANALVPAVPTSLGAGAGIAGVAGGYTASVLVAAVAVGPLGLFESSPMAGNVGPSVVLDSMDDAVVVVDDGDTVVRLNAVACETFGTTATAATGGPLTALLGDAFDDPSGDDPVALDTADGVRQFRVTRSPVTDRTDCERGYVLVLRDVTRRRTREQRLTVFNRVLRHNLRNDANSIIGRARLIGDGGDPDPLADEIVDTTRDLVDVAERARELDRTLTAGPRDGETDVSAAVDDVIADVAADHDVEITAAVPDDATAAVAPSLFDVVLCNVVENAAEHNDADQPLVTVTADVDGSWVDVTVADNGPGIPEQERAALERGTEEALTHGSGLGLWVVYWGLTRTGGRVAFADNDPRGSRVTLRVPAAGETGA
jgi:signal transduction histidine kinase